MQATATANHKRLCATRLLSYVSRRLANSPPCCVVHLIRRLPIYLQAMGNLALTPARMVPRMAMAMAMAREGSELESSQLLPACGRSPTDPRRMGHAAARSRRVLHPKPLVHHPLSFGNTRSWLRLTGRLPPCAAFVCLGFDFRPRGFNRGRLVCHIIHHTSGFAHFWLTKYR